MVSNNALIRSRFSITKTACQVSQDHLSRGNLRRDVTLPDGNLTHNRS
jgi:hypothetical protein